MKRPNLPTGEAKRKPSAPSMGTDQFYSGVLVALGCVYFADEETLAEEIVGTVGEKELLRVAVAEEDCYLPNLKRTIAFLKSRRRRPVPTDASDPARSASPEGKA